MKNIGRSLDNITSPIFSKNGFVDQKIIKYWPLIVGDSLAKYTSPIKITFAGERTRGGVLHIGISNPSLSLEIQSQEFRFIEKISTYFGYQAVSRIRLSVEKKAGKKPDNDNKLTKSNITESEKKELLKHIEKHPDPELRKVFQSLLGNMFESQN